MKSVKWKMVFVFTLGMIIGMWMTKTNTPTVKQCEQVCAGVYC